MKISKNLLQAIMLGVTLGTSTASCQLLQKEEQEEIKTEENCSNEGDDDDLHCLACGLG